MIQEIKALDMAVSNLQDEITHENNAIVAINLVKQLCKLIQLKESKIKKLNEAQINSILENKDMDGISYLQIYQPQDLKKALEKKYQVCS